MLIESLVEKILDNVLVEIETMFCDTHHIHLAICHMGEQLMEAIRF